MTMCQPAARSDGTLQGPGLSVSWNAASNIIANATWAFRIGNNPFTDDPSQNQDGSSSSNRLSLNASVGSDNAQYVGCARCPWCIAACQSNGLTIACYRVSVDACLLERLF